MQRRAQLSASAVFPHLPKPQPHRPGPELRLAQLLHLRLFPQAARTSAFFTMPVTVIAGAALNPTVSPLGFLQQQPRSPLGRQNSAQPRQRSATSHGLPETTGFLATSPEAQASTSLPAPTLSPGGLGPPRTSATTVELYPVTAGNTETSPPATSC